MRKDRQKVVKSGVEQSRVEQSRVEFGRVEVRYTLPSII